MFLCNNCMTMTTVNFNQEENTIEIICEKCGLKSDSISINDVPILAYDFNNKKFLILVSEDTITKTAMNAAENNEEL